MNAKQPRALESGTAPVRRPFSLIGELMNNSFARARKAWSERDLARYQELARLQVAHQAHYLTVNIDGTQTVQVKPEEMLEFLPELIPALQEAVSVPLAFDHPSLAFHREALKHYDRSKSPAPILNSLAASRQELDAMIELVAEHDTMVIVMASEKFTGDGGSPCTGPEEVYQTTRRFAELLATRANRRMDQIIVDPGLAPVGADTYGLVNMGLDAMKMIREDPDLNGIHLSVGLTNFSFGTPRAIREDLENSFLTLAVATGLDFVLANPEKNLHLLADDHPTLNIVKQALADGRPQAGESVEDAGFRQAERIMELYM